MWLVYSCLYLYLLLKPFYLSKSGTLQISDFFIFLAFFFLLIYSKKHANKEEKNYINKIKNSIFPLVAFVLFVISINSIYFLIYGSTDFIISSLQYVFILIGVYVFGCSFKEEKFIFNLLKIIKINIIIQLLIYIFGYGRYFGIDRYMGTFNDPNQFAFFLFLSISFFYIINKILKKENKKTNFIFYAIVLFLIIESSSVGMLLAIGILYTFILGVYFKENNRYLLSTAWKITLMITSFFILFCIFNGGLNSIFIFNSNVGQMEIIQRLNEKISRFTSQSSGPDFFEERGYDKIFKYPKYLIYGSGQGDYERFTNAYHMGEIHATLPSIMFYYGIFPSLLLFYWLYKMLKSIPSHVKVVFVAILVESFTLLNERQLLLWALVMLSYIFYSKEIELKNTYR